MKNINSYIVEKLKINKDTVSKPVSGKPNGGLTLLILKKSIDNMLNDSEGDDVLKLFKKNNSIYNSIEECDLWDMLYDLIDFSYGSKVKTSADMIKSMTNINDKSISSYIMRGWKNYLSKL